MGVGTEAEAAPASAGAVPTINDPVFTQMSDQLADKGFVLTTVDDLINWSRTGSLMWMTFGWPAAPSR